jgi:hypothetical protein
MSQKDQDDYELLYLMNQSSYNNEACIETLPVYSNEQRLTSWPLQRSLSPKCKMASQQLKAECVLWFHEPKSVTKVQRWFQPKKPPSKE